MITIKSDTDHHEAEPSVATIGYFDGVHRGHRHLISALVEEAENSADMRSMVISFDQHPRQVLRKDYRPRLLTTPDEKLLLLSKTGIDCTAMLHFDTAMAALSAQEFMRSVLSDRLNVKKLIIGYDNRFGHNRADGFDDYVRYGRQIGIEVTRSTPFELDGVKVSSSVVRSCLEEGEVEMAEKCLGYPYFIAGHVVGGFQEGRKIGFPTANVRVDNELKLIPKPGVYAVKVRVEGSLTLRHGMMNIGTRPTFNGHITTLEANIFNFEDDIYGQSIDILFCHRLREERRFSSIQKLQAQLSADREEAERLLSADQEAKTTNQTEL